MKSLFMPLMVSIILSRLMELFALWKGEIIMGFACRGMIWALLGVANHFKSKKQYTDELVLLIYMTFVLDTGSAIITSGLFNLYSLVTIYLPGLVLFYIANRTFLEPHIQTLVNRVTHSLQQYQQQQQAEQQQQASSVV